MKITLSVANIVVLAKRHNPGIPSKDWLKSKRIIKEVPMNFVNTPVFSMLETKNFVLTVDEKRLQISAKKPSNKNLKQIVDMAQVYVKALPETPYNALGLNFIWTAIPATEENGFKFLKKLFVADEKKLSNFLPSTDYYVGSNIYYSYSDFRVTLKIEPLLKSKGHISLNFNYHLADGTKLITEKILMFSQCLEQSGGLVKKMTGGIK